MHGCEVTLPVLAGTAHLLEAAFWGEKYVTLGEEENFQAFSDEPDAKNLDLAALLAETFK